MVEYRANFGTVPEVCPVLYHPHQEIRPVLDISSSTKVQEIPLFLPVLSLHVIYLVTCAHLKSFLPIYIKLPYIYRNVSVIHIHEVGYCLLALVATMLTKARIAKKQLATVDMKLVL